MSEKKVVSKLDGIVTGDWHIDRFNRLDDMAKCVDFAIDEAIRRKVKWFVHTGDLYRNFHPAPCEQAILHRMTKLPKAGIETFIVVGNHDTAESREYGFMHCVIDFKNLNSGIHVMDKPRFLRMAEGVSFLFMPHVPKAELQESGLHYDAWYAKTLGDLIVACDGEVGGWSKILFSHAYVKGAKVGPCDLIVESSRQVGLDTLRNPELDAVFLGDIHKPQTLSKDPLVIYPGSLDRVDFGEADDEKGITYFHIDTGETGNPLIRTEFINTPARKFKQITVTLNTEEDLKSLAFAPGAEVDGTITKLTIKCAPSLKRQIDDDAMVKALEDAGATVRSVNFEVDTPKIARAAGVVEGVSEGSALETWVGLQNYPEDMAKDVLAAGKKLIGTAA